MESGLTFVPLMRTEPTRDTARCRLHAAIIKLTEEIKDTFVYVLMLTCATYNMANS